MCSSACYFYSLLYFTLPIGTTHKILSDTTHQNVLEDLYYWGERKSWKKCILYPKFWSVLSNRAHNFPEFKNQLIIFISIHTTVSAFFVAFVNKATFLSELFWRSSSDFRYLCSEKRLVNKTEQLNRKKRKCYLPRLKYLTV